MKGVLICGGSGTRLKPLTEITNKSLLPVYDRPLILEPLDVLRKAGIREIIVISGTEHIDQMGSYLGSGERFGCSLSYRVQERAGGIAQALGLAEDFAGGDSVCAILGDNIYFDDLAPAIRSFQMGGHVFLKEVPDPERFGVADVAVSDKRPSAELRTRSTGSMVTVRSIEEKPAFPKSNLAVTGCYLYDNRCFDIIRQLQPSPRGELEITDVNRWYVARAELTATVLQDVWIDAGTFESLFEAARLVRERRMREKLDTQQTIQTAAATVEEASVMER